MKRSCLMQQIKPYKLFLILILTALTLNVGCGKSDTSAPDKNTQQPQPQPEPEPEPDPKPKPPSPPQIISSVPKNNKKVVETGYEFLGDTKKNDFIKQHATYKEIELIIRNKSIHILYVGYAYNQHFTGLSQSTWFYNNIFITDSQKTHYFSTETHVESIPTGQKYPGMLTNHLYFPKDNGEDPRNYWMYKYFKGKSPAQAVRIDQKTWIENARVEFNFSKSKCLDIHSTPKTLEVTGMIHFKDLLITDRHVNNLGMFFMFDVETAEFLLLKAEALYSKSSIIKRTPEPGQAFRKYIRRVTNDLFRECNDIYLKAFPDITNKLDFKDKQIALTYNEEFERSGRYKFVPTYKYDRVKEFYFNYTDERSLLLDLPIESNLSENDKKLLREHGFKIFTREELIK